MIPEIKKLLYATDLSQNSIYAFRHAAAIARKHEASIVLLHVIEKLSASAESLLSAYLDQHTRDALKGRKKDEVGKRVRQRLENLCQEEAATDPALAGRIAVIEVVEGYPPDIILKKSDEHNCDIIVVGAHGKGILENTFLGSVSRQVLRRTRKPTYVIPLPHGEVESKS
jgi:nucleotide-binding universal stress UspA family protein